MIAIVGRRAHPRVRRGGWLALVVSGVMVGGSSVAVLGAARGLTAAGRDPSATPVGISVAPGLSLATTRVVSGQGGRWFGAIVGVGAQAMNTIRIYSWRGRSWSLAARVPGTGVPGAGALAGQLRTARLTGGLDFTITNPTTDWDYYFEVVAELGGHWRAVPFESQPGLSPVISSRYQHGRFVQGVTLEAHIVVSRVRCAAGWAVASAARDGSPVLVLFEQTGRRWLRTSIGTIGQLNSHADSYAFPSALLKRLEMRLGLRHAPPLPCLCRPGPPQPRIRLPRTAATPVVVPIVPGAQFVGSGVVSEHHTDWYAAAVITPGTGTSRAATIYAYRWTGTAWSCRGQATFRGLHIAPYPTLNSAPIKGSQAPEFQLMNWPLQRDEPVQRLAAVNNTGGHWHAAA